MTFDSSALCARTPAGVAELALPCKGLSLGQRRVLTWLESPAAADELAQKHDLEPEKLARDLTRLAELHLVQLPVTTSVTPAAPAKVRGATAPVRGSITGLEKIPRHVRMEFVVDGSQSIGSGRRMAIRTK